MAIYDRYSFESHSEHAIDDQVRICRACAEREGWTATEVYADYALSGATTNRPRLEALVADVKRGRFDIVLAEALDRVSRDQEHTAGIWKSLAFADVKLVTLSEGEITELHVGLKGAMNALFLKDLAAKTHRGLAGRVEAGKSGGGLSYGYRITRQLDARGEPVRGDRMIDQETWQQVQGRLGAIRDASGANDPQRPDFWTRRRPQHILTGKLFCGICGGVFGNSGRDYLACNAAKKQAVCDNHRSIRRQVLEDIVLDALRTRLMEPSLVALFISEFTAEWNRPQAEAGAGRAQQERELAQIERKLCDLIDAIADGLRGGGIQAQLDQLEVRKIALSASLAEPAQAAPRLHPNLANLHRDRVAALHVALRHETDGQAALEVVRGLIERITLTPTAEGDGLEVDITGEIAAIFALGMAGDGGPNAKKPAHLAGVPAAFACSAKVVAGTGFGRQLSLLPLAC